MFDLDLPYNEIASDMVGLQAKLTRKQFFVSFFDTTVTATKRMKRKDTKCTEQKMKYSRQIIQLQKHAGRPRRSLHHGLRSMMSSQAVTTKTVQI